MSITPEVPAKTLMQMVATRIRVAMAVEDIRQSELSRRMGKTEQWLSVRLRGKQAIDLNDLLLIAQALEVGIHDLLPSPDEASEAAGPRTTHGYLTVPVVSPLPDRPKDNRPASRPVSAVPATMGRTSYLNRPGRRHRDR